MNNTTVTLPLLEVDKNLQEKYDKLKKECESAVGRLNLVSEKLYKLEHRNWLQRLFNYDKK